MSKRMSATSAKAGGGGGSRTVSRRIGKRRSRAAEGLETAPDGTVIGQDPRRLSPEELRALGHRGKPLLQAMRKRCIDCCGGKSDEVRRCTAVACPLWPYRMATDPWHPEAEKPAPGRRPAALAPQVALAATTPMPKQRSAARPPAATARRRGREAETPLLPFLSNVSA